MDLLLIFNQEACDTYCWDLRPTAWILVDKDLVTHPPSSRAIALPFTAVAPDKLKKMMVANVVALGAISELTGIVTRRSLERSLLTRVPQGHRRVEQEGPQSRSEAYTSLQRTAKCRGRPGFGRRQPLVENPRQASSSIIALSLISMQPITLWAAGQRTR